MKNRFGKYRVKNEDVVELVDAECAVLVEVLFVGS